MIPPEDQTAPKVASRYIDPEAIDMSEQQFAASLEGATARPHFVLEEADAYSTQEAELGSEGRPASCSMSREARPLADEAGCCPTRDEREQSEGEYGRDDEVPTRTADSNWREEVSAKVNRYKMRRPRQERYPSLQLQFEPVTSREKSEPRSGEIPSFPPHATEKTLSEEPPASSLRIMLEATARVLEFPRTTSPPAYRDELAEPVIDRPRILEAPELLPPPPAMGGILIEPSPEPEPERRPGIDVPLQTAPLNRRLWAAGIDATIVAIAVAVFGYLFTRLAGTLPPLRPALGIGATLLALFWASYQYAFLVFSETTPGLGLTRLRILSFDGTRAPRALRRWRALASILSGVSLGLGYAWCFLDEDQLSWHDRITKTHLAVVPNDRKQA